jgi:hypothetical protein
MFTIVNEKGVCQDGKINSHNSDIGAGEKA